MRRLSGILGLLLVSLCLSADSALAGPFPVTNVKDSGDGSLRQAILAASSHIGSDSIPIETVGVIDLQTPLPAISDDVVIAGPGAEVLTVRRASGTPFRVLHFGPEVTASLSGITVSGGRDPAGGGIFNDSGTLTLTRVIVTGNEASEDFIPTVIRPLVYAGGGGIFSAGPLILRESFVHGNNVTARGGGEETLASGGGIEALNSLTVERSTIAGNVVEALGGSGEEAVASGGGVLTSGGSVTIEESTVSGNSVLATAAAVAVAMGGGAQGNGIEITGSTVTGNSAAVDGPGAAIEFSAGANLNYPSAGPVRNTIVSDPQGEAESCAGTIVSGGFNLDEDGSCGFGHATDLGVVVAGLDPVLKDNGGPTPTHALLEGSIAIDRGNSFGFAIDQRGLPRPSDFPAISNIEGGDGSDIGAFELQAPMPGPEPVRVTTAPGDTAAPNTRIVSGPPRNTYKREAKFRFSSGEQQSTFQCRLDKKRWYRCASPSWRTVKPGKHVFKVRALDRFGNVDPTPARFGWRVKPISG